MLETRKLTNHKHSQCHVEIEDNGTINFISYTTLVIRAVPFEGYGYILYCTGTYSQSTRRQIGWFLKEYFGDISYYDMKRISGSGEGTYAERKHAKFW
jgi:hypothetical protein